MFHSSLSFPFHLLKSNLGILKTFQINREVNGQIVFHIENDIIALFKKCGKLQNNKNFLFEIE